MKPRREQRSDNRAVRVPFAIAAVAAGLFAEVAALTVLGRAGSPLLLPMLASIAQFGAIGVVGSLVLVRQPAHRVGWAMVLASTWTAVIVVASTYLAIEREGGPLAAAAFGTIWLSEGPLLAIWLFFLYTFPTGAFASHRDRRTFTLISVTATVVLFVLYLVAPPGVSPSDVVPVDVPESVSGPLALGSHHIGLGARHRGKPIVLFVADRDIRIVDADGELLRELVLDPTRDYQRQSA